MLFRSRLGTTLGYTSAVASTCSLVSISAMISKPGCIDIYYIDVHFIGVHYIDMYCIDMYRIDVYCIDVLIHVLSLIHICVVIQQCSSDVSVICTRCSITRYPTEENVVYLSLTYLP